MVWIENKFDDTLLKILDEEVAKEKAKKKKKPALDLKKEKSSNYYSGWHKDDMPVTHETKEEKQKKLSDINLKK
ncbi:MAG: hypothetical protein IH934_05640 [Nanoarchaeota archaeon]|nr:hypothetical protein [Nanoarchaeota archaeon]